MIGQVKRAAEGDLCLFVFCSARGDFPPCFVFLSCWGRRRRRRRRGGGERVWLHACRQLRHSFPYLPKGHLPNVPFFTLCWFSRSLPWCTKRCATIRRLCNSPNTRKTTKRHWLMYSGMGGLQVFSTHLGSGTSSSSKQKRVTCLSCQLWDRRNPISRTRTGRRASCPCEALQPRRRPGGRGCDLDEDRVRM
ncbi:hypothetical protein LZ31DRAFT_289829 [Colletotrichum somersetense]|nr:hypothetical protein LZ31DRAFT_289829 [Colletotrichum somersetense]